jgi:uncharacterized membrane protein
MDEDLSTLTTGEKAVVAALVLVYLGWKAYKLTLMEHHGPFSWQFLGASALAGGGIVVLGMGAFWCLHWLQRRRRGHGSDS